MTQPQDSALKFPAGQTGQGLKSLLSMLTGLKSGAGSPPGVLPDQIAAELAYKLAQASAQASDRELLKQSLCDLLDAVGGLSLALSGKKADGKP